MIRKVSFRNCYSFRELSEVSFVVNNNAPISSKYITSCMEGDRLSKMMIVLGHNGSGKTTILRVLKFLKDFVLDSFAERPEDGFAVEPFLLKDPPYEPVCMDVEFEIESVLYRYSIVLEDEYVKEETLDILDLENKQFTERKRFRNIFSRSYDSNKDEIALKSSSDFELSEGLKALIKQRKNASLISAGIFSNHKQFTKIKNFWSGISVKDINYSDFPQEIFLMRSSEFYYKNIDFKNKMESMLLKADLGVVGVDIEKIHMPMGGDVSKKREIYLPYGIHKGAGGKLFRLPFTSESGGTQQIYMLMSKILPVLESGGISVIDELESELHADILPIIFDLFENEITNPKGAQLIFTSHETKALETMDKYQVLLVEKNDEGVSKVKRGDELNVRSDDNLFTKYWSGKLGGRSSDLIAK